MMSVDFVSGLCVGLGLAIAMGGCVLIGAAIGTWIADRWHRERIPVAPLFQIPLAAPVAYHKPKQETWEEWAARVEEEVQNGADWLDFYEPMSERTRIVNWN